MISMMMCQQRTTRSPLSAGGPSSFTLFFYALSLSLFCVCVCMCVYVCIYITTIRVPSFPLRSFPKGSRVQPKCGGEGHHENLKYEFMNSRVCVCVCVCLVSLSLSGLVVLLLFRRCFLSLAFWTFFFPETSSKSRSLSLACCRGSLSTRTLFARREDRQTLFAQRERERVFGGRRRVFERETR